MAIYSTNRTRNPYSSYDVEPNEEYFGEAGCYQAIAENYINDLNFFNAVIATDFEEIALGENAYEIELLQEATGESIIDKIKAFVKKAWEKIKGLFQTFIKKITILITRDNKELVNKYKKEVYKKDLSKMKYKWCAMPKNGVENVTNTVQDGLDKLAGSISNIVNSINDNFNQVKEDIDDSDFVENKVLPFFLDKDGKTSTSMSEFKKDFHDAQFEDEEEEEGLSGDRLAFIVKTLIDSSTTIKHINKLQSESDKYFKNILKSVDDARNAIVKNSPKDDDKEYGGDAEIGFGSTDKYGVYTTTDGKKDADGNIPKNRDLTKLKTTDSKNTKLKNSDVNSRLNTLYSGISKTQTGVNMGISAMMTETKFLIAMCRKVFGKAVTFNPKSVKESAILAEAYGESLADDMEMFMDSYEF